jgi:diguanylate cyclase (GGDEF)-like protein
MKMDSRSSAASRSIFTGSLESGFAVTCHRPAESGSGPPSGEHVGVRSLARVYRAGRRRSFQASHDRYGHAAGDLCLKRVAAILAAELRGPEDHAIRYGGEEFLVLLPNTSMVDAMRVAERMRVAIERAAVPNEGCGPRGIATASFGVASAGVTELTAAELIAAADNALYAAKRNGRNQVWPLPVAVDAATAVTPIAGRLRA